MNDPVNTRTYNSPITAKYGASEIAADGYVPLTAEGILLFCQSSLQKMDTDIQKKMRGQEQLVGLQDRFGDLASSLKAGDGGVNDDAAVAFDNAETVGKIAGELDRAIEEAKKYGKPELAKVLENVKTKLLTSKDPTVHDNRVTKEEVKDMCAMLDEALAGCRSGAELSMIDLQSLVSKRATMLQLCTNLMNTLNEGIKSVVANVGRS